jgi:hypothetical protein
MGKKSLIKSTTKKKASSPKKSASKQSAASEKSSKSAPKKPVTQKKAATAATRPAPKSARKSNSPAELLKRSFGTWSPDKTYVPPADLVSTADYTAPPVFDGSDEQIKTLKSLLARQFDLTALAEPAAVEAAPAADGIREAENIPETETSEPEPAPEPPREPVPVAELLKRSFGTWSPDKTYAPPAELVGSADYTAPPFFDGTDEETKTVKALLARQFDLTALTEPAEEETAPAADATPEVENIPETETSEPEPSQTAAEEIAPTADAVPEFDASRENTADETATAAEKKPETPEVQKADETPASEAQTAQTETETPAEPAEPEAQTAAAEPTTEPEPAAPPEPVSQDLPAAAAAEITPEPEPSAVPESEKEVPPDASGIWSPPPSACAGPPLDEKEPPNTALRVLIGCLAAVFAVLMIASALNSNNFYLEPTAAGLEIWRGKFSPKGKTLLEILPDVDLSIPVKSVYSRDEAMTVVFEYYMNQANQRAGVVAEPDFDVVAEQYAQARTYAPTSAQAAIADNRLRTIRAQSLISAADMATANPTPQNIDRALALLHEAAELATDRTQQQLIRVKIDELTTVKTGTGEEAQATPAPSENENP